MSLGYLLDTNICIYALSGRYPRVQQRIDRHAPGRIATSVIVYGELQFGIAKSARREDAQLRLDAFMQIVNVLPLPFEATEHYGDIRALLAKRGTPIGGNDLWIAAHARAANVTLVTNNIGEFERVPGLRLANWAE
jgi:tRNA(fMet)-specific endonuclease VapC